MKTQITKNQTILIISMVLALIISGVVFYSNRSLKDQLQKEKINSETLLSEKLNLQKSIDKFKKDLTAMQGKSDRLDKVLAETSNKLNNKESEIRKLLAENASINDLRKKNAELEALRKKLNEEIIAMNINMEKLITENKHFNEQFASIKQENESLITHNALLEAMLADNYRIEALRGKGDKLTVSARRTNRLMVSFDIPSEVREGLYFKIVTPDGKELSSMNDDSAIINFYNQDKNLLASTTGSGYGSENSKRAELIYKPEQKLVKGIYRFNVYNGKEYVGSIQLRLK